MLHAPAARGAPNKGRYFCTPLHPIFINDNFWCDIIHSETREEAKEGQSCIFYTLWYFLIIHKVAKVF
jgi:hypothetical protein